MDALARLVRALSGRGPKPARAEPETVEPTAADEAAAAQGRLNDIRRDEIIGQTIDKWEGVRFTNHPADRGGPTRYGITLATLSEARGKPQDANDVRFLTRSEAVDIFRRLYWERAGVGRLPSALWPTFYDAVVNHGPTRAAYLLQRALNRLGARLALDGEMGSKTVQAAWVKPPVDTVNAFVAERLAFYDRIIERDPTQAVFEVGWKRRAESFQIKV